MSWMSCGVLEVEAMLTKLRSQSLRPVIAALGLAVLAIGASVAVSQPAEARGVFVFGFGNLKAFLFARESG